jgi:KaiC/GvpD/RAD55 family RecA-like ATPase
MIYKTHELESNLLDKKEICVSHIQEIVERYESDLESIQQEIDHRVLTQANTASSQDVSDTLTENLNTNNKFRETLGEYSETIDEIITKKYYFLLKYLNLDSEDFHQLRTLLEKREKLALKIRDGKEYFPESGITQEDIWEMEEQLADIDIQIEQLLDSENLDRYVLLKNSDIEQKQFNQYSLGVSGLFPLDVEQQESVLFARLRHKAIFDNTISTLDIETDYPLTKEQRDSLLKQIEMAAMRYKHGFLMEAHTLLDHDSFPMDQYTLLENYTNTEFTKMIDKLRAKIDRRGIIN